MVLLIEGADDTEKDGVIVEAKKGNDDDDGTTEGVADGSLEGSSDRLLDG